ncbi:hypothetical protein SAMN02745823_02455 [Sporobacter termitidis DSM 10068]|uniref:DUF5666 domain-containing protein n=1 Tax=Sporobacter termitidis DSM 10068 TaxID=1123282 RepID=A0A1M5YEP0_9FIRM|nr:hypothetical protein [Sporobacter termitidis]SHI10521.1 hypothetical protein SAMN02745823_02455 [Sporobacter termitidis DSM 10068]
MYKKIAALVFSGAMLAALAGCAGGGTTAAPESSTPPSPSPSGTADTAGAAGTELTGRVTAVSSDTITLELLEQNAPQGGDTAPNGGGTPSAPGSAETPAPVSGAPSGVPGGSADPGAARPSGGSAGGNRDQSGGPGGGFGLTPTGETRTITVSSDTAITVGSGGSGTAGTIADIKAGDILRVTMDGDAAEAIVVENFGGGQRPDGQAGDQTGGLDTPQPDSAGTDAAPQTSAAA